MSHQLKRIPTVDTTPTGRALPYIPEPQRERTDNTQALPDLARECRQRGLTLKVTSAPGLATLDGRTLVVPRGSVDETLNDIRLTGRCIDCTSTLDATALPYADGYNHLDGTPIRICQPCRIERKAVAADPARQAFTTALSAIEAAFKASQDPARTRKALETFVEMLASETRP
ncbi:MULTISPECIES: hypothetical protein [unclassified Streptomyces]|uniref:hypothetical protein n=1 Tax=unclassified Streptomyces TaxID=2593676 RepID=UPI00093D05F0|nr:hypothetical protein [Streptomyces sp. CB01883]OKJ87262.1 hypothetical protein AMK32_08460 [Streptomyces sp. CB01883]